MTDITRLLASLKRRSSRAKEFGHDVLFVKLKDIDALVEALEKAQQNETQASEIAVQLSKRLTAAENRISELDNYAEAEAVGADKSAEDSVYWMNRCKELESRTVTVKLPEPYAYLRENNGQIQISIGAERPSDRSGGYATPWFAIYTAAGIKREAE